MSPSLSAEKPFSIISDRRQSVGVSDVAEQNRQRRHHSCCRARKRTLLQIYSRREPKPETLEHSSYASQPCECCTSPNISLCSSLASRFLLLVRLTHSVLVPAARHICMRSAKSSAVRRVVIVVLQKCLLIPFFTLQDVLCSQILLTLSLLCIY